MSERIQKAVTLSNGRTVTVAINRRGCEGPWTDADDEALRAILDVMAASLPRHRAGASSEALPA